MAAPSGVIWGSTVGNYGRIGIYKTITKTNTNCTVNVQIWFWSKYSVSDTNNTLYYDNLSSSGSATTSRGAVSISTTVDTGSGWSTTNQKLIKSYSTTYTRTTSDVNRYLYAKLANIDRVGGTMYASTTVTIPKLDSYKVTYNANGGTGAPAAQTKWYGKSLPLQSDKPDRYGYSFAYWLASNGDKYNPGEVYTVNADLTLSAVWKANTYKVTYNANGGSGAPADQTKTYGVTLKLSTTAPTRTNYNFLGWATSKTATTATYKAGANYTTNSATTLYAVWELAYVKPRITSFSVIRCDSSGTASDTGTYGLVKFNWACDRTVTSIAITVNGTTTTVSATGTSGSVSKIIGGSLSSDKTYPVTVKVTDSVNNSQAEKPLNGTKFAIDVYNQCNGIAFGKPAEISGRADFNWPIQMRNGTIYAPDLTFNISNMPTPDAYRPYRKAGDSVTFTIYTSGFVTNSGKDVYFVIPFSTPIIGAPVATAASINGFVLRQNGQYTHGSSTTVYANPKTYVASCGYIRGVYIKATFEDTTNVVNNSSIGIYWNGTITFE